MQQLRIQPLSREAFAPYGDVISTEGAQQLLINNGSTVRFHDLASIDTAIQGGRTIVNIFRAQPLSLPLQVAMLERHPLASQAFIPMGKEAFLVLVAAPRETPRPGQIQAFLATAGQGVNYHKGVWHHPVLALQPDQDFIVIDRGGEGHNCDEFYFSEAEQVVLPAL